MKLHHIALFATLLTLPGLANAEFVESHVNTDGDALATLDTKTGLEWLDLTVTDGNSINQALSRTNTGGDLEGWRLPTYEEVLTLANNLYSNINTSSGYDNRNSATTEEKNQHMTLFGQTATGYSYGLYSNPGSNRSLLFGVNYGLSVYVDYPRDNTKDYAHRSYGVYLVSEGGLTYSSLNNDNWNVAEGATDVPLPVGIGLFSIGLFALTQRQSKQGATL